MNLVKTLYVSREDPAWRLKKREIEINESYGYGPLHLGIVKFVAQPLLDLTSPLHIAWLRKKIRQNGFTLLILDILNRMYSGEDENSAKDMGEVICVLETLNRKSKVAILALDHTRKPFAGNRHGPLSPFDIKGSLAKFGAVDFALGLSSTKFKGDPTLSEGLSLTVHQSQPMLVMAQPKGASYDHRHRPTDS